MSPNRDQLLVKDELSVAWEEFRVALQALVARSALQRAVRDASRAKAE